MTEFTDKEGIRWRTVPCGAGAWVEAAGLPNRGTGWQRLGLLRRTAKGGVGFFIRREDRTLMGKWGNAVCLQVGMFEFFTSLRFPVTLKPVDGIVVEYAGRTFWGPPSQWTDSPVRYDEGGGDQYAVPIADLDEIS